MTITSSLLRKCSSYNMIMRSGNVLTGSSTRVSSISTSSSISKTLTSKDVMLRSMFTNTNNTTNTGTSISTGTTTNNHQMISKRHLGRKAGKMGKHLETLNEMAHREEHKKAKDKKKNKKKRGGNNKGNEQSQSQTSSSMSMGQSSNEIPDIEEDDTETIFDHGGNSNADDDDDLTPSLPDKNDVKIRMMKVVNAMEESFKKIRGAEATPELFETVQVKAYGSMSPLNGVAQVVINTPTMATITCFDPDVAPDVRDAVRDMAGLNFNPRIEDGVVLVPIPRVSAETRKALVKQLGKTAENTKQRLRRIRRAAQDVVKKAKDGKLEGISEDDSFRTGKEIDAVTEECINALNEVVDKKQASVMNV